MNALESFNEAERVSRELASPGRLTRARAGLRLTNDDGTPTLWWAFLVIIAPSLVVLSIVAVAIARY